MPDSNQKLVLCLEIESFSQLMQQELDSNSHKGEQGSWIKDTPESLLVEVMDHVAKLVYAVKHDTGRVDEFAADVANMAMMTRDAFNYQKLLKSVQDKAVE